MSRADDALSVRQIAATQAYNNQSHVPNGDERAYSGAMSFTKGLPHDGATGLVADATDFDAFRAAIDRGVVADFDAVPLGDTSAVPYRWRFHGVAEPAKQAGLAGRAAAAQHRRWEAPTAGFVFDLEGPDAQAVTMPPAPALMDRPGQAGAELVAEMSEVYWLALLRDVPFHRFDTIGGSPQLRDAIDHLSRLPFYQDVGHPRRRLAAGESLGRGNIFRGHTPGDRKGPYLSQFLLVGNEHLGIDNKPHRSRQGQLQYGALRVDLRVRSAVPGRDFMTHWDEWLDVQNGADVRDAVQDYRDAPPFRFIATPRDLATYVHFDALYEAYLNACLWLLGVGAPLDPRFAATLGRTRHTEGFALFGGPHVLTLVTEVATRALKAVRWQKFNVHLRLRPEALAGRIAAQQAGALSGPLAADMQALVDAISAVKVDGLSILDRVAAHNKRQNRRHRQHIQAQSGLAAQDSLPLLPMAFAEGSPMHPSYGAGHAAVAGACVTILKAFFDEHAVIGRRPGGAVGALPAGGAGIQPVAFVPNNNGSGLRDRGRSLAAPLTVGDELNKLAANISIGRNMGGVHYYSDYIESLRMGEAIAVGILREQALTYPKDTFTVSLTTFDGATVII